MVYHSQWFVHYEAIMDKDGKPACKNSGDEKTLNMLRACFYSLVPFASMTVLNILIVVKMYNHSQGQDSREYSKGRNLYPVTSC